MDLEAAGVRPRAQGVRLPARRAYSSEREKHLALSLTPCTLFQILYPLLQYSITPSLHHSITPCGWYKLTVTKSFLISMGCRNSGTFNNAIDKAISRRVASLGTGCNTSRVKRRSAGADTQKHRYELSSAPQFLLPPTSSQPCGMRSIFLL